MCRVVARELEQLSNVWRRERSGWCVQCVKCWATGVSVLLLMFDR